MRFRHFILLEQDPMGGGMDPMGGPPGGGQPMGGPPGGGMDPMGGPPMGGGMDPMGGPPGGAAPTPPEPQPIPQHADVWTVLDSLLSRKPIEQEEKLKKYQSQKSQLSVQNSPPSPGGPPPGMGSGGNPMGGMGGPALMS